MANALAEETSPYLLQHSENPVDWLPWGEAALARARERDRPLLVSIGYSSCHWCHVMEHESFEDEEVARLMNERFVCVKVDREERPDVDAIYMEAVQAMTGHGGWPLNVFLSPEQVPFFGGTYFPPESRPGMPGWRHVLIAVSEAWSERKDDIRAGSGRIVEHLNATARMSPSSEPLRERELERAVAALESQFDARHGGFGGAPKFPPSCALELLLRRAADRPAGREATMALATLRAMAAGGICDQVGGGFARYAVDATWTVPHFEKMLYDNALLAGAYLHGWRIAGEEPLLRTCTETLDWALREMRAPDGGFHSALDADSEGREGTFYVWTVAQLRELLGELADEAIAYFGATKEGNFEGANVLEARGPEPAPGRRAEIRERLLQARERRPRPGLDDKRLTAWNALMVRTLAEAGAALGDERGGRYLSAAREGGDFLLTRMRGPGGDLMRTYKDGRARIGAFLEDHAFLLEALLALYEATFEARWFGEARRLAGVLIERFADPDRGGFFSTPVGHEDLIARRKELQDSPLPSGFSSATLGLLRLARLTGEAEYERQAVAALRLAHELAARHPLAFGHLLQALAFHLAPARELAVVGDDAAPLLDVARRRWRPDLVVAAGPGGAAGDTAIGLLEGRAPADGGGPGGALGTPCAIAAA
jgi:uncharacterized protein YyaL (SSP411 family)